VGVDYPNKWIAETLREDEQLTVYSTAIKTLYRQQTSWVGAHQEDDRRTEDSGTCMNSE